MMTQNNDLPPIPSMPPDAPSGSRWGDYRPMQSRYDGKCRETGEAFTQGSWILWNSDVRTVYGNQSMTFKNYLDYLGGIRGELYV